MQEKKIKTIDEEHNVRVRFAPAPTGMLHLGNIRTALINYLFARQKKGTFVLRIEDTDEQRNFDPNAKEIIGDINWLGLDYDEGPIKGGPYEPYFQSKRSNLYKQYLEVLRSKEIIYRCFCSQEELEKKRQRQIAMKQPPRYDRTCLKLTKEEIEKNLDQKKPFIWRVKIPDDLKVEFIDMARGKLEFDLKNFSDYPVTRQDGSFTFIFANCVDDIQMKMTHVFRGEDHISNTVDQIVLYNAFDAKVPIFYHMPIICDINGKKLSKRNFGFSLNELRESGYLPEAICNYLAIIGTSFENEIQSLAELVKSYNFNNIHSTGHIKYDIEKLNWINHKWILQYDISEFAKLCMPYLEKEFPSIKFLDQNILLRLLELIKSDCITLKDSVKLLKFYFEDPIISLDSITKEIPDIDLNLIKDILKQNIKFIEEPDKFINEVKKTSKNLKIKLNIILPTIRFALTGSIHGLNMNDLIEMLDTKKIKERIESFINSIY